LAGATHELRRREANDDLRTFGGLGVSLFTGFVIAFVLGVADAGDPFSS
jgi:hypothetical protein